MRETISINIGQAGVKLANSYWDLFCMEHSISPQGKLQIYPNSPNTQNIHSFFTQTDEEKYVPRTVFIDLEPTAINHYKQLGQFRNIYHQNQFVSGKEDTGNNYARGYYTLGKKIIDQCMNKIRKQAEKCTNLQGFIINHSIGGGTGSGLASLILQNLSKTYQKKPKLDFSIYPSQKHSKIIVEPYNQILSLKHILQHANLSFVLQNAALYRICQRVIDIDFPGQANINRIISHLVSNVTSFMRFGGSFFDKIGSMQDKLVPYHRFKFMQSSYAPLHSVDKSCGYYGVQDVQRLCFERSFMMANSSSKNGKYMACSLIYRGDCSSKQINDAISYRKKQKSFEFVDWAPRTISVGVNQIPPICFPDGDLSKTMRSCAMVANCSGINEVHQRLSYKFDSMLQMKAFVHWYEKEGMELQEFIDAGENVRELESQYEQAVNSQAEEEEKT